MKSATTTTKTNGARLWQESTPKTIHTVRHVYLTTMTMLLM